MDYKKYSLENLENWLHDALSAGEASPQEIYDTIKNVVEEQHTYYKNGAEKTNELLSLLNGHRDNIDFNVSDYPIYFPNQYDSMNVCDANDTSDYCTNSWTSFWQDDVIKQDKVVKWQLPVELDDVSEEYYVQFPDDLMEAANLKGGDTVEWVDNGDGSYTLRKTNAV
jgi:hypothetical protein